MRFDIISANPDILQSPLNYGLISRARVKGYIETYIHNLRDYAEGSYKQIDDEPYGGGAGMILKAEPFFRVIKELLGEREYDDIIYFSAQGEILNQKLANQLSLKKNFILLCGHYKGIDERVIERYVTKEISIGEYVLSCGDLAALVLIDAISRLIPGVLHDGESAITDTFQTEEVFDCAYYTRPEIIDDMKVPSVLLSGNHSAIEQWRRESAKQKLQKYIELNENKFLISELKKNKEQI
ncbi:MAG: tRNA (guanosine(37)-N1)-methyltransferase TrmD [Ignavibacteria bacterium]|nr:tRNA (guanosine(37)-N1)-methyltransferase TrmD [Ignavibacteria bacterium]